MKALAHAGRADARAARRASDGKTRVGRHLCTAPILWGQGRISSDRRDRSATTRLGKTVPGDPKGGSNLGFGSVTLWIAVSNGIPSMSPRRRPGPVPPSACGGPVDNLGAFIPMVLPTSSPTDDGVHRLDPWRGIRRATAQSESGVVGVVRVRPATTSTCTPPRDGGVDRRSCAVDEDAPTSCRCHPWRTLSPCRPWSRCRCRRWCRWCRWA